MRWIIGDVHGMLKPLQTLLSEIARLDPRPLLYFVGDYVNRGPDTRGVIDLLLKLQNARFVRGNHDDMLDQIIHGEGYADNPSGGDRYLAFQWFLEHGLLQTLRSYGVNDEQIARVIVRRKPDAMRPIIELFPPEHRQFIHNLQAYIEDEDLFVVHGRWPLREKTGPHQILGKPHPPPRLRHELLWARFSEADLHRPKSWPKTGFFGHTPVQTYKGHADDSAPLVGAKMILIDTAAFMPTGRLSAICAENAQLIQADHNGKLCASGQICFTTVTSTSPHTD